MGKNQSASNLTNVIQISSTGNVTFVSGSTTLMSISSSGAITTTGVISGSNALSASYAANADTLDGLNSTAFATTGAYSDTSGSLYTVSSSAYATSGSLSTASGSLSATSGSLSATSGSLSTASGSFNTRVSALEVTGSALSSSILSVSSSAYATSGSLSTASGSFDSRVASLETYSTNLTAKTASFATTGSNTFISTQVISGSILQSGSFTTTGTIIAQTINVQSVTSSVVYSSGSNVFGNDIGNSQTFTGSVLITGSLAIAGAVVGSSTVCSIMTNASCFGVGTITPLTILEVSANNNALGCNNTLRFTDTDTATEANQQIGKIEFYSSDTSTPGAGVKAYMGAFASDTTPDAYLSFATQDGSATPNPAERLRISSEGIACFSGAVCASSFIGGTMSGTTIYGSTAVCSPVGKFTTCLDLGGALTGTSATFSSSVTSVGLLFNTGNYLGSRSLRAASDLLIFYGGTAGFNFTDSTNSTVLASINNSGVSTFGTTASTTYGTLNIVQQSVCSPSFVRGIELVHPNGTGVTGGYIGISMTGQKQGTIQVGDDSAVGNLLLQSQGGFIGLNCTDPKYTLDVNGLVNINAQATNCQGTVQSLRISSNIGDAAVTINACSLLNYTYLAFAQNCVGKFELGFSRCTDASSPSTFYLNPNVQSGACNAAIFIKSSGCVGIGRGCVEFTLDVNGDIALNRQNRLHFASSNAGDRCRSFLAGDYNNNIFVCGPSSNPVAMFMYTSTVCLGPTTVVGLQGGTDTTVITGGSGYGSALRMNYAGGSMQNLFQGNGDNFVNCVTGKLNAAGGIKFANGATTLNYYEEGTWTPRLQNGSFTTNAGVSNVGWYTRIGNLVTVGGTLDWGAGSGAQDSNLHIVCLPFASSSTANQRNVGQPGAPAPSSIGFKCTGKGQLVLVNDPGYSFIYLIETFQNGTYSTYIHNLCVANAGTLYGFQITYHI